MMFIIGKILWQGIMTLISFKSSQDQGIILFSYLMVFLSFIVFNLFDVSIFDLRLNILGWIILAAISGVREKDVI